MKNEPLLPHKIGIYVSNDQTTVDIGDVLKISHTNGLYFAEIIAIETGDAGEALIFQYIKASPEFETAPTFTLKQPFSEKE